MNLPRIEDEMLLLCVRSLLAPAQLTRVRQLAGSDFDWNYFYSLARRHSVVPLVFSQLGAFSANVPTEVLARFKKDFQENAARNVVLADELVSIIKALADAGVDAITFKGPTLAVLAYGDLSQRRFVDLDLIVRRADVSAAIEVLSACAYIPSKSLDPKHQELLLNHQHNLQFTRDRMIVELHWQVASALFASSVTAEELWQQLDHVRLSNAEVKTLSRDDLLFALCVHGSRHVWQRLAWICDIDRVIKTAAKLDWPRLIERADTAGARRMFLLGPALAANLLETPLPDSIGDAIHKEAQISALVQEIQAALFDEALEQGPGVGATFRYNMLVRSDWRSRWRYFRFALALTDADFGSAHLPSRFHFIYYLLRPFRLWRASRSRGAVGEARN